MIAVLVVIVLGMFLLRATASWLNWRNLIPSLPEEFTGFIDPMDYLRSQDYTRAKILAGMIEESFSLLVFLGFWLAGGFAWLYSWSQSRGLAAVPTGVLVIGLLYLGKWLLDLPFEIHRTFGTEARFGFNRTSPRTFVLDQIKGMLFAAGLGLPVLAGLLAIFARIADAWLWGWLGISAIALLLSFLAPSLILPMFNKFEPMPAGPLRAAIEELANHCGFPLGGLFVMDGSKRSTKANAFFTGFGKNRRIAMFDTLINAHPIDELVAVLAHEIGHFKCRHIWKHMALGFLANGLLFFLLGMALHAPALYDAFGIHVDGDSLPLHFGLVFFFVLYAPISQLLAIIRNAISRKHEYEADAYAAKVTGSPVPLATALRRLSADSLSNLTPHPLTVWLDHTHPPVTARLRALAKSV